MTTTQISHVQLQYSHTIGRGEQFGPGFTYPVHMARGADDLMYVLCRSQEYRPEGTRITVCTVGEEYINVFAPRRPSARAPRVQFRGRLLVWPVCVAVASDGNVYVSDEWLNRISIFTKDGDYVGKWEERVGDGEGELKRLPGWLSTKTTTSTLWTAIIIGSKSLPATASSWPNGAPWVTETASSICPGASQSTSRGTYTSPTGATTAFRSSPLMAGS